MSAPALHAVLPAAGIGVRMGAERPKQYLSLDGEPVIAHSLRRLLALPALARVVVCLHPADRHWAAIEPGLRTRVETVIGGAQRAASVSAGLDRLVGRGAAARDWVLVHDAARPAVRGVDIERLLAQMARDPEGGALLAVPVRDTLKRGLDGRSVQTLARDSLWQAQTPQVFELGPLRRALRAALAAGAALTDEASAMEWAGGRPALVEGRDDNVKITRPGDLVLAAAALGAGAPESVGRAQRSEACSDATARARAQRQPGVVGASGGQVGPTRAR